VQVVGGTEWNVLIREQFFFSSYVFDRFFCEFFGGFILNFWSIQNSDGFSEHMG
jgi:hypothetical protein